MEKKEKKRMSVRNKVLLLTFVLNQVTMAVTIKGLGSDSDVYWIQICNLLLYLPCFLIIQSLCSFKWAGFINTGLLCVIATANEAVLAFRGRPINFIDIYSVGAAFHVASNYRLPFNYMILINLAFSIVILLCYGCVDVGMKKEAKSRAQDWEDSERFRKKVCRRLLPVSVVVFAAVAALKPLPAPDIFWQEDMYVYKYGLFYAWYCEYKNSELKVPDGYSPEAAEQILAGYSSDAADNGATPPDRLIVIMNESLTDYSLIGEVALNADPLRHIHEMEENCAKGRLAVNVYGGQTCNTEFEFLTGCSLAFYPDNAVPYMQYNLTSLPSLAKDFEGAEAMHPYLSIEWHRDSAYTDLGFRRTYFGEDFGPEGGNEIAVQSVFREIESEEFTDFGAGLEYIRGFISDRDCYRKILDVTGQTPFVFAVTIQNHGGYELPFEDEGMVDYIPNYDGQMEQFLNLTRISDDAFYELTEHLKDSDERTVVVMFGDHQPGFYYHGGESFDAYAGLPDAKSEYEEAARLYTVPYIVWANYDVEWDLPEYLSVNYLSAAVKRSCGYPLTAFDRIRLNAMQEYPVLTSRFVMDQNGVFDSLQTALVKDEVRDYRFVQYEYNQR